MEKKHFVSNKTLMSAVRSHLRNISNESLPAADSRPIDAEHLKMVFNLLEKLALAEESLGIQIVSRVPDEYFSLISNCHDDSKIIFLNLLASEAEPHFTLLSLHKWMQNNQDNFNVIPMITLALERSAMLSGREDDDGWISLSEPSALTAGPRIPRI